MEAFDVYDEVEDGGPGPDESGTIVDDEYDDTVDTMIDAEDDYAEAPTETYPDPEPAPYPAPEVHTPKEVPEWDPEAPTRPMIEIDEILPPLPQRKPLWDWPPRIGEA